MTTSPQDLAHMAAIIESSDDAIISTDLSGIIKSWNGAAERIYGYSAAEAIGQPITILIPQNLLHKETVILEKIRQGERIDHYETVRQRKDGSQVCVSLTVSPIKDASGRIMGASKSARDITERKRIEAELRARQEDLVRVNQELEDTNRGVVALYAELDEKADHLRRADQTKTRFLANMSHEFRTPLSSILALSALLLKRTDGELTDEQDKQVQFIRKGAESLLELVNDLLDLAKIEAGKVVVRPIEFEVKNMFSALRGMLRPLLVSTSVQLVFDEPEGLPPLHTDEGKISQVLRNFLSNALKFTERGEIRVTATIEREQEHLITLAVADSGIGIAPDDQTRIFEEFTQLDNPMQRRFKGIGLGLPLCRKLAILLGGSISVESRVGMGSVFKLTIPLKCPVVAGDFEVDGPEEARTLDPSLLPVLVVEDEPQTRLLYEKFLRGTRYQPLLAASLRHANRILQTTRPAAIVLDILLAGEDSWQWLASTKGEPPTSDIPILVATTVEDQAKGLSLGADAYCLKPLDRERLVAELERLTASTKRTKAPANHEEVPTILIVDDEATCRYILGRLLRDTCCEVLEAKDGSEALRICQTMKPALIFLDLNMPGLSGWDVIRAMAALPELRQIPIVVVTSHSLSDESRSSLQRSTHSILMKDELSTETVQRVINETVFASQARPCREA